MTNNLLQKLFGIGFIALVVWYGMFMLKPPDPKPETAPDQTFSAERAFKHVEQTAQKPHPLGSEEHDEVRNYVTNVLRGLGVKTKVNGGIVRQCIVLQCGMGVTAYIENIFAKIPGTDPQKTILLMAHYDSSTNAAGAGDDAAGVAAILEVIRIIKKHKPLKNNLWVLITDGEEPGLLGAEFFIQNNDGQRGIDLVLNVEARGSSGASFMFETSENNAALIPHFAKASTLPLADSFTNSLSALLPNDTDLSVMKKAGLTGLNFAFIEDHTNYHTLQDNPENLSLASLQHHGSNLLSNVLYFGNKNFDLDSSADMVYFNNLRGGLIYYPASSSFPIALALGTLFFIYLITGFVRNDFSIGKYFLATGAFILLLVLGALLTFGVWTLAESLHPAYRWLAQGEVYVHEWYLWGFCALMLSLSIACYGWLQTKLGSRNLMPGIFTVWIILSVITSWYLPSAGYLFVWPVLFAVLGWIIASGYFKDSRWAALGIICLSLAPAIFMVFPFVPMMQVSMTTRLLWFCMFLLMLLIGLCWPLIRLITQPETIHWSVSFAALFLIAMIGASINSGFDAEHKKQNSIVYALDLNKNKAWWFSGDPEPDEWTAQFLGKKPKRVPSNSFFSIFGSHLKANAPFNPVKKATITLLADSTADALRYVNLKIQTKQRTLAMALTLASGNSFKKASVERKKLFDAVNPVEGQRSELDFIFHYGNLQRPLSLLVAVPAGTKNLAVDVEFISKKLFEKFIEPYRPRAAYMMPKPFNRSDAVIWKQQVEINELR